MFSTGFTVTRQIEQMGIRLGNDGQGLIVGARHDAGLIRLAPLLFQAIHTAVEVEVETAHGYSGTWVMSGCCLANMTISRQLCGSSFKAEATPGESGADRRIGGRSRPGARNGDATAVPAPSGGAHGSARNRRARQRLVRWGPRGRARKIEGSPRECL